MGESGAVRSRAALPMALRVLLILGFLIAAAATALVVFAEAVPMLRLAAVLALWAALIAAFAVTRSRRDARAAAMREGEAQLAYQLELHREVAARREYEADLSQQVAAAQSDQIGELREQLERLTGVLSSLVDGELTVSRLTLSAESASFRPGQALSTEHRAAVVGGAARPVAALAGGDTVDADPMPATRTPATPGVRPDAPAAAWARRHADRAEAVETAAATVAPAAPAAPAPAAHATPPPAPAPPAGRSAPGEHEVTRPLPVVPEPRAAAESDGRSDGAVDPGNDAPSDEPGDHESGVSVADLLAAYGLSGRSRRRRQD